MELDAGSSRPLYRLNTQVFTINYNAR